MIVLYAEDIEGQDLAASSVKSADVVDAFTKMQEAFVPTATTVQVNQEGRFFVANLTGAEAKKLAGSAQVEAVVDDIPVYALGSPFPRGCDEDEFPEPGGLEVEAEDIEAIEANPYPELGPDEEQMSAEQLNLLCQLAPSADPLADAEAQLLLGEQPDATALLGLSDLPAQLLKYLPCVLKCLADAGWDWKKALPCILGCVVGPKAAGGSCDADGCDLDAALGAVAEGASPEARARAVDLILPNLRMIYAPQAWRFSTGAGVRVAVVDTGISSRHADLRVYGGVSYVPGVSSWRDDHGHGTHCAGIIAAAANRRGIVGVAPRARLYAVKVLNRQGSGMLSWILNGLTWCYRHRMHVVNLSLGSRVTTHDPTVFNAAYERVGRSLRRRGILCVAAAGNGYHKPVGNPARCPSYMAVSAIDYRRRLTTFTNVGPQVEICAPGYQILSTVPGGYGRKSGTSMACPHVAGAAALVKARHPAWHGDHIRVHLWRTALDLGTPGRDWAFGYGQVNALRAVL